MIFVSGCLVGENCKYNGENNENSRVLDFLKDKEYITICPECMGGLPTPRHPSEIKDDKVINCVGEDVTCFFKRGAEESLKLANSHKPELIILKSKSPSCGLGEIYDGTFSKTLIKGDGITCRLLIDNGYKVITEKEI